MAVSQVLSPFVRRVVIANPLQVKAIAHARVKTTRSTPARWRVCLPLDNCRKSGLLTLKPSGSAG